MFARAFGILCCFCLISYHLPGSSWYTYHNMCDRSWTWCGWFRITYLADHSIWIIFSAYRTVQFFRLQTINRKITYCYIGRCSLLLSASCVVSVDFVSLAWQFVVYISQHVRSIMNIMWFLSYHIHGSSCYTYHIMWVDEEHHVVGFVSHTYPADHSISIVLSEYHTLQFFRLQKINRKIAYCCIRRCSLVLSASCTVSAWFRITYLAIRGIHVTTCAIDHEHDVVDFVSHTWQIIQFELFLAHIARYSFFSFKQ